MATKVQHAINDISECGMNCRICYRQVMQMKWLIAAAAIVVLGVGGIVTAIEMNRADISRVSAAAAVSQERLEYVSTSINDVKKAMGLEVRMPPKLEALKGS